MGKRGPAPKPTNLRILHGDRADRINTQDPQPTGDVVCPPTISAAGRAVWVSVAPDLVAKKVLTPWDVDTFAALCELIVVNRQAAADVAEKGMYITTVFRELADGTVTYRTQKNPAWQVERESTALLVTLGGRFGLNPSDRSQLKVGHGEAAGKPGEDLLSG